ncbi:hypothetical protein GCM10022243_08240 [Saccharothrix violaceirubra]|uniref:PPE family protein n=1 Tax=Saccharothrix violaceirubra TaxID=413306 RepID=A0A7W7SYV9_9PSEU|nr:hypothetical protein [Saccharothrix violaceirubra]MBB4963236.1 hypothetical protein [Saccharothrix violaceirubra]
MGDGVMTGFNSDWQNPDNFAGAGPVETFFQTLDAFSRVDEADFAELGMNAAAFGLDLLGTLIDPLGSLATAGIGWLIEHLSFLREPLDWLAGNGDKIKAAVGQWNKAAAELDRVAQAQHDAISTQVAGWEQGAADKFRASQGQLVGETLGMSRTCLAVAEKIATAGTVTAAIRGMIRDLIAMFVWEVIRNAVIALASSWITLGGSLAAFAAWAVGRGAVVLGKVTAQIAKLMRFITRLMGKIKGLFGSLGDMLRNLTRFGKGARGTTRAANAPSTPRFQGMDDAAKRMEDWGNARPTRADVGTEVKQAGREFGDAYKNAGETWARKTEGVTYRPAHRGSDIADGYTPFKPPTRADGTAAPHSVPSLGDGAFVTKLTADLAREASKQDELQNEGVPKGQQPTFKRQTGYLDE